MSETNYSQEKIPLAEVEQLTPEEEVTELLARCKRLATKVAAKDIELKRLEQKLRQIARTNNAEARNIHLMIGPG